MRSPLTASHRGLVNRARLSIMLAAWEPPFLKKMRFHRTSWNRVLDTLCVLMRRYRSQMRSSSVPDLLLKMCCHLGPDLFSLVAAGCMQWRA